jgi:membrane protease subunit HflK
MYAEYALNPEITKTRMYYEAIQDILPGITVYIDTTGEGNVDMMLPLSSFTNGGN